MSDPFQVDCDLGKGSVNFSATSLTCNGALQSSYAGSAQISGTAASGSFITIDNAAPTVFLNGATIQNTGYFRVSGSEVRVHLSGVNSFDFSSLTGMSGIHCSESSNLTFQGSGSLATLAGAEGAGIGTLQGEVCGSLTFFNGTFTAVGYTGIGPNIALDAATSEDTVMSEISILGGRFNATGDYGAGIGSGAAVEGGHSKVFGVSIFAGTINASARGVGIGAGWSTGPGSLSEVSQLTITGGIIDASASTGPGLGSAVGRNFAVAHLHDLTIDGGVINAIGGRSAAIGTGDGYDLGESMISNLTLLSGTINANGRNNGIGSGMGYNGSATVSNLTIAGGWINATATFGSGIGSGHSLGAGNSTVFNLTILGGNVVAISGAGPGIGSGQGYVYSNSTVDFLRILGGTITATGCHGAGVGAGWGVDSGNSTISEMLIVDANIKASSEDGAGIGTGHARDFGLSTIAKLSIFGGNVEAKGLNGAGIGAGYAVNSSKSAILELTIAGANVNAIGENAAGIGSGLADNSSSSLVSKLSVVDVNVTASGSNGAGIGSGFGLANSTSAVYEIAIFNGCINAWGSAGAGIGSGSGIDSGTSAVSDLAIVNGTITATGRDGAGIGSGSGRAFGTSTIGKLTITGGQIGATGEKGAGIGSGFAPDGLSRVSQVTITDATIDAAALDGSAGIGAGCALDSGMSSVLEMLIAGGNINAKGQNGAGVGSGYASGSGSSVVTKLTIATGTVNASGFNGAGIGSGYAAGEIAASTVGAALIGNGSFTLLTAFSGVGFGPSRGSGSGVGDLTIRNGRFDCGGLNSTDCFDATSVTFGPGSTVAFTGSTTVVSPGWTVSGSSELYFEYLSGSSQERPEAVPLIHLASISFPVAGVYFLTVSQVEGSSPGFERVVEFNYSRSQDCAFSVPSVGKYQIAFRLVSGSVSGRLACDGLVDFSVSGAVDNFYSPVTPLSETASLAFTLNAFLHKRAGRFILKGLLFAFVTDWRF